MSTSITGTVTWLWRDEKNPEKPFRIARLHDETSVLGDGGEAMQKGLSYEFYGEWEDKGGRWGRQFRFTHYRLKEPVSRQGVIAYLKRYAYGVGPAIASQLWDKFGEDAVKTLRNDPDLACDKCPRLNRTHAQQASLQLKAIQELEDVKIELTGLFAGRGFPASLVDACIERWKILAPQRVRRDPFSMLVEGLPGAGFSRCDTLYDDLGLPPGRLKRQVICLWHSLRQGDDTWVLREDAVQRLEELVAAEVHAERAVELGVRSKWLAEKEDEEGVKWLAVGAWAREEAELAEAVITLAGG